MTCEAAKRILHPGTTREALAEIGFKGKEKLQDAVDEACLMACEALDKQIPKSRPAALTGHGERLRKKPFVPHVITPLGIGNLSAAVRKSHTASTADRLSLGRAGNGQIETLPVLRRQTGIY